eukprot:1752611-Amphidinium_carterae.1
MHFSRFWGFSGDGVVSENIVTKCCLDGLADPKPSTHLRGLFCSAATIGDDDDLHIWSQGILPLP